MEYILILISILNSYLTNRVVSASRFASDKKAGIYIDGFYLRALAWHGNVDSFVLWYSDSRSLLGSPGTFVLPTCKGGIQVTYFGVGHSEYWIVHLNKFYNKPSQPQFFQNCTSPWAFYFWDWSPLKTTPSFIKFGAGIPLSDIWNVEENCCDTLHVLNSAIKNHYFRKRVLAFIPRTGTGF